MFHIPAHKQTVPAKQPAQFYPHDEALLEAQVDADIAAEIAAERRLSYGPGIN